MASSASVHIRRVRRTEEVVDEAGEPLNGEEAATLAESGVFGVPTLLRTGVLVSVFIDLGEEFKLMEEKEEFSSPTVSIEVGKAEVLRAIFCCSIN